MQGPCSPGRLTGLEGRMYVTGTGAITQKAGGRITATGPLPPPWGTLAYPDGGTGDLSPSSFREEQTAGEDRTAPWSLLQDPTEPVQVEG